jgi:hypothetical protein
MRAPLRATDGFSRILLADYPEGLPNDANDYNRHGGRVWAEAQPGQGATFSFILGEGLFHD